MTPAYALYRRSSTQQDLSVEEQRQAVRAWAAERGYTIVREFADDASGLDTERRRGFLELLQVCGQPHARQAEVVLCYDVSRFSRLDPDEAAFHEYSLRRAGVRVIYTHDPGASEDGLAGHLVKSLKRVLAHEFSQKLSQLVRRGHRAHAALGHWSGGRPPYGLRRALLDGGHPTRPLEAGRWKARGERVTLVVEPIEAEVVRWVFDAYTRRGLGLLAIASTLNARGVPPPGSLRRLGRGVWAKGTVWAILRNPAYKGDLVWGRARYREVGRKRGKRPLPETERVTVPGGVPAIVTPEVWEAAQRRHGQRRFASGRPWHRPYLLSGLIECGHCSKRFQAQRQARGHIPAYYLCGGYLASGAGFCDSPRIPTTYLEEAVLDGIHKRLERLLDPEELRRRLDQWLPTARSPEMAVADLEDRLRETQARIARLVTALAAGPDDLPSVRAALVELEPQRQRLEDQIREARMPRLGGERREELIEALIESLGDVRQVLGAGGPEERKAVVRCFLERIRVEKQAARIVLRWYRLPGTSFVKVVAVGGIEPPTQGL